MTSQLHRSSRTYGSSLQLDSLNLGDSTGAESDCTQHNISTSSSPSIATPARRRSRMKIENFKTEQYFDLTGEGENARYSCKTCQLQLSAKTSSTIRSEHAASHLYDTAVLFHQKPQEEKMEKIVELITSCAIPFKIVEHEVFREITGLKKNRVSLGKDLERVFIMKQTELMHRLNRVDFIAITTDLWTSSAKRPYACYTAHFLEQGKLQSVLLDFVYFEHPHTAANLCNKMRDIFSFYDIEKKVIAISADGAANNKASLNTMNLLRGAAQLSNVQYIHCVCHVLNLVVKHACMISITCVSRARELCKSIRASTRLQGKLSKKVLLDCPTRWNSTYIMLKRLIEIESEIKVLYATEPSLCGEETFLPDDDWSELKNSLIHLLEPFQRATESFSKFNESNYAKTVHIYRKLIEMTETHFPSCFLRNEVLKQLEKYKPNVVTDHAMMAAMLDPYWNRKLNPGERGTWEEKLREATSGFRKEQPVSSNVSKCGDAYFIDDSDEDDGDEISRFLNEKTAWSDDIVAWWQLNKSKYPSVYQLARQFFIIRPSSVPSESAFSTASWIISPKRTSLGDQSIRASMFLHSYFNQKFDSVLLNDEE